MTKTCLAVPPRRGAIRGTVLGRGGTVAAGAGGDEYHREAGPDPQVRHDDRRGDERGPEPGDAPERLGEVGLRQQDRVSAPGQRGEAERAGCVGPGRGDNPTVPYRLNGQPG